MMFITRAMDTQADRLGPELTAEWRQLLIDRINMARVLNTSYRPSAHDSSNWQNASARAYRTAAQVAWRLK